MNQDDRRDFLIRYLLSENPEYRGIAVPEDPAKAWRLLRSLMNLRPPMEAGEDFLSVQDEFLREEIRRKGITDIVSLDMADDGICLWKGDITTLRCDAVVNAANSGMTGCYLPCHGCIDNAIHTYAGVQLRRECAKVMRQQVHEAETGQAWITPGFSLPSRYVIHTVGPVVHGNKPSDEERRLLASCYESCLAIAEERKLESIAFCCISTGEFHFPNADAAAIAAETVREWKKRKEYEIKVVFDVYKDCDEKIYRELLGRG